LSSEAEPVLVGTHGSLLGVMEQPTFVDTTFSMTAGDVLLLYTDGVTEGRREASTYGEDALLATLAGAGAPRRPTQIVDAVMREVTAFQSGTLRDDIALVAFGPSL
jgi:sigma-B regulation protein RsbU (phosphoserine phosphatase)